MHRSTTRSNNNLIYHTFLMKQHFTFKLSTTSTLQHFKKYEAKVTSLTSQKRLLHCEYYVKFIQIKK